MFFKKSRIERDIEGFKAMQDKGSRLAKSDSSTDEKDDAPANASLSFDALRISEQPSEVVSIGSVSAANGRHQSIIGANATWKGKLSTDGSARIEGDLSGEVEAGDTVFIEKGAKVRANIQAGAVIVGGDLEGQITCREQLVVQRSGSLGGEVTTKTLVIEEGAIVHGAIRMSRDDEPGRGSPKKLSSTPSRRDPTAPEAVEATKG